MFKAYKTIGKVFGLVALTSETITGNPDDLSPIEAVAVLWLEQYIWPIEIINALTGKKLSNAVKAWGESLNKKLESEN